MDVEIKLKAIFRGEGQVGNNVKKGKSPDKIAGEKAARKKHYKPKISLLKLAIKPLFTAI